MTIQADDIMGTDALLPAKDEDAKPKRKKNQKMEDDEVVTIMEKFINSALNFANSELSTERAESIREYYGKPYGDEEENHSSVVARDLYDTVEWMLPTLLEIFFGSGKIMKFDPKTSEDVEQAKQETDVVNHLIAHHNKGFLSILQWIKDSLVQKNGFLKFVPQTKTKIETETYENLTDEQFEILSQELMAESDNVKKEVIEYSTHEDNILIPVPNSIGQIIPQTLHDIKIKITKTETEIEFMCVPPEEVLVAPSHAELSLRNCQMIIHQRDMTVTELLEMGFDEDIVNALPTAQLPSTPSFQQEYIQRQYLTDVYVNKLTYTDASMRPIRISEGYGMIDYDGDGVAELNQIFYSTGKVLQVRPFEYMPFASITPTILSHQFFGLSIADVMRDLQRIKTQLWRQMLDNIYTTNNNRHAINDLLVDSEDLYHPQPGQIIRCQGNPYESIMPLQVADVSAPVMQMMEYIDDVAESRSGVSKNTTGLNPDILNNNKGDSSVWRLMTAATQRINFIARCFAETGFRDLFLGLHQLMRKYQNVQQEILIEDKWININPRTWKERDNVSVRVGLGTGDKDVLRNAYTMLGQIQNTLLTGGKINLVSDTNIYNLIAATADTFNIKNIDDYFTNPQSQAGAAALKQQQQAAQQNPQAAAQQAQMQLQMQIEQMKLAQKDRDTQVYAQVEIMKEQMWKEIEQMKLSQKQANDLLNASLKDSALHLENARVALEESKTIHDVAHKTTLESHNMLMDISKELRENKKVTQTAPRVEA
jgi:hypothetical protein